MEIINKIVLVKFPFADSPASKVRPALCLSEPLGAHQHVILAFISSNISNPLEETDVLISENEPDFQLTGLRVNSVVKLHRLTSMPVEMILRELGKTSESTQKKIKDNLKSILKI